MQVSLYTKAVLTVIAAALCAIVVQNMVQPADASKHKVCGMYIHKPCYIWISGPSTLTRPR